MTQDLSTRLGQSIIVDNRPGGMTQVAMDALVRAPADGYTLMLGTNEMALLPFALGCAVSWMPPTEFVAYITDETRKWSQLIPAMGISIEE